MHPRAEYHLMLRREDGEMGSAIDVAQIAAGPEAWSSQLPVL